MALKDLVLQCVCVCVCVCVRVGVVVLIVVQFSFCGLHSQNHPRFFGDYKPFKQGKAFVLHVEWFIAYWQKLQIRTNCTLHKTNGLWG